MLQQDERYRRAKEKISQVIIEEFEEDKTFADYSADETLKHFFDRPKEVILKTWWIKTLQFLQRNLLTVVLIGVCVSSLLGISWLLREPVPNYPIDVYTSSQINENGRCFNVNKNKTNYKVCVPKELIPSINEAIKNAPQDRFVTLKGNDGKFYLISKENNQTRIRVKDE